MTDEELNQRFKELEEKIDESSGGLGCAFVVVLVIVIVVFVFREEIRENFFNEKPKSHQPN